MTLGELKFLLLTRDDLSDETPLVIGYEGIHRAAGRVVVETLRERIDGSCVPGKRFDDWLAEPPVEGEERDVAALVFTADEG